MILGPGIVDRLRTSRLAVAGSALGVGLLLAVAAPSVVDALVPDDPPVGCQSSVGSVGPSVGDLSGPCPVPPPGGCDTSVGSPVGDFSVICADTPGVLGSDGAGGGPDVSPDAVSATPTFTG